MSGKLSKLEILKIFSEKFVEFLDCILEIFPTDQNILFIRTFFSQGQFPVETAMRILKNNITPVADIIRKRDESFFTSNASDELFSGISDTHVIKWRTIWTSDRLDAEDKECIWQWITLFLNLAEKYE
jgi:hypothetical protein